MKLTWAVSEITPKPLYSVLLRDYEGTAICSVVQNHSGHNVYLTWLLSLIQWFIFTLFSS